MKQPYSLNTFESKVERMLLRTKAPGCHAARSALRYLERAWSIQEIAPELAIFSLLTAEEESTAAVFHALSRKKYSGANKLNRKNHTHKSALYPFLIAISQHMRSFLSAMDAKLEITDKYSKLNREELRVVLSLNVGDRLIRMYPEPPFNFSQSIDGREISLSDEIDNFQVELGATTMFDYAKSLANKRNIALYAGSEGIPTIEHDIEKALENRKSKVFVHLCLYLLIDQYETGQVFIQKCLDSFLEMLEIVSQKS